MANSNNSDQTGLIVYDGTSSYLARTLTAGTGISINNGDGVSGNPTISGTTAVATSYSTDSGTATPAANNLNVLGGTGITTSGASDAITFAEDGSTITTSYAADSGTATPTAGVLNISGGTNVTTSASGNTITVNATGGGGSGDFVLLDTSSTVASGYIEFTSSISSSYFCYWFILEDVLIDDPGVASNVTIETSEDGGSTWNSFGDFDYSLTEVQMNGSATTNLVGSTGNISILLGGSQMTTASNDITNALVRMYNPAGTTWTRFNFESCYEGGTAQYTAVGGGVRKTTTAVNAVRFGNITSGTIRMYGMSAT